MLRVDPPAQKPFALNFTSVLCTTPAAQEAARLCTRGESPDFEDHELNPAAPGVRTDSVPPASRSDDPFVGSIRLVVDVGRRMRFRVALIGGFALPFHGVQRATGDVDFLVAAEGADVLHETLLAGGARCLHRSADAANYASDGPRLAPVDFIYAHRPRARDMLTRARPRPLHGARLRVPVVDAEALIGLKLQALVNEPGRVQDEADIRALLAAAPAPLDLDLLRDYYRLFGRERDLDRLLAELKQR
jgi:hypothetical protein